MFFVHKVLELNILSTFFCLSINNNKTKLLIALVINFKAYNDGKQINQMLSMHTFYNFFIKFKLKFLYIRLLLFFNIKSYFQISLKLLKNERIVNRHG